MIELWPTVAEERKMELLRRGIDKSGNAAWRSNGLLLFIVLFVLTCLTLGAAFWFLSELKLPEGVLVAAMAIAVAELLIVRFRFFETGVESALWIGGLFAWIFGLKGEARPEVLLLFAAAAGAAGFRVRNALFGALAAAFVIRYFEGREWHEGAAAAGIAISVWAIQALTREWRRPSTEMLMTAMAILSPIAGAIDTAEKLPAWWALAYLAAACACLYAGVTRRMHAPLIAAAVHAAIVVATLEVHDLLPLRGEWRLIAGGAILFAAAALVSRALRGRTRGIVITPGSLTAHDDELQIVATLAMQPKTEVAPAEGPQGGGGRFGGGGATGDT